MKLTKENKWLIIFATIFILVGIALSISIQRINRYTFAQKHLEDATDYKMEINEDGFVERKITFYGKGKKVVGKLYFLSGDIEGIPGSDGFLSYQILIDGDGIILAIEEVENHHTIDQGNIFYNVYLEQLNNLKNTKVDDLKIDGIAGATYSYELIKDFFNALRNSEDLDDFVVDQGPQIDPYEELFGEYEEVVLDDTFTATEIVTKKEIIKDAEGNQLGYAYTASKVADIPYQPNAVLELLVAIDSNGKILGIYELVNEHTQGETFYLRYKDTVAGIKDIDVKDLNIEKVAGATTSYNVLTEIFNAIKEAEGL